MAHFSDEKRRSTMSNSDAKTKEEPSGDEHLEVDRGTLQDDGEDHNNGSNAHTPSTAQSIGDIRSDRESEERAQEHDTAEQSLDGARRIVHVC